MAGASPRRLERLLAAGERIRALGDRKAPKAVIWSRAESVASTCSPTI
jgi:hypothetical protein